MKTRLIGIVSALALALGTALVAASPAEAATPAVMITKVYYNSPGTDTRTNTSLNAEWVRMTNERTYNINLLGWSLRDRSGHIYRFGTYTLRPGKNVYVHTGRGTNGSPDYQHLYWGSGNYIWNNDGDTAYLRNASGALIDSCSWGRTGSYTYC